MGHLETSTARMCNVETVQIDIDSFSMDCMQTSFKQRRRFFFQEHSGFN